MEPLQRKFRAAASCTVLIMAACDSASQAPTLDLPNRPADATGGAAFVQDLRGLPIAERERRIYQEVSRGNVPGWLRRLRPVELRGEVDGRMHRVTFWAAPDYLAVGSDSDFVLVPLTARTARRLAERIGGSLPTPRMVDAIWAAADVRFPPVRITPDDSMRSVRYFERHNSLLKAQRFIYGTRPGAFVAGHKLDVVLIPRASADGGNVALYGWHLPGGQPIQSLVVAPSERFVIFSHGTRLVHRTVSVDGEERDISEVLRDPALAPILTGGGAFRSGAGEVSHEPDVRPPTTG